MCLQDKCKHHIFNKNLSSVDDLSTIIEACQNETVWHKHGLEAKLSEIYYCKNKNDEPFDTDAGDWVAMGIFILILMMVIFGSIYDTVNKYNIKRGVDTPGNEYILSFSLFKNWNNLTTDNEIQDSKVKKFTVFHGFRVLCMVMVIWGHVNYNLTGYFVSNPHDFEKKYETYLYHLITSGTAIVQIFLVMSGFLLVFNSLVSMEKEPMTWRHYPLLYFNRWCRLTPAIAVMVMFTATWLRHLSFGPLWHVSVMPVVNDCRRYWWTNLLYINNYVPDNKFCGIQTWYTAAEFQAFSVGLAMFIATVSRGRKIAISILFLLSVAAPAVNVLLWNMSAILIFDPQSFRHLLRDNESFHYQYKFGHNNLSCYIIGMALGYLLYDLQKKSIDLSKYKILNIFVWVALLLMMILFASAKVFYLDLENVPLWFRMTYAALIRPLTGVLVAFIFAYCNLSSGSLFLKLWSCRLWTIPSRLSYCVFLVHFNVYHALLGVQRHLSYSNFFNTVFLTIGIVAISCAIALPLHLMVEAPMTAIGKTVTNKLLKVKTKKIN